VHYDRPIIILFLDRRRGCEKLSSEGLTITAREGAA